MYRTFIIMRNEKELKTIIERTLTKTFFNLLSFDITWIPTKNKISLGFNKYYNNYGTPFVFLDIILWPTIINRPSLRGELKIDLNNRGYLKYNEKIKVIKFFNKSIAYIDLSIFENEINKFIINNI